LRPLSCTRPKALFPVVNKPLLQWTFERLAQSGVDEAILAVNGLTEFYIRQHRLPKSGLTVKYSHDPPNMPLGTAGPIKKAEKLIGHGEPFIVLNGDIFADINYREMLNSHLEGKAIATIALHEAEDPSRYGVAELAADNRIRRFIEKPPKETTSTNLINAGVYVLSPKIFEYIPAGRAVSMEREVFPRLADKNALYGHKVDGLWIDIGKPEEYLTANKMLLDTLSSKQRKDKTGKYQLKNPIAIEKGVIVGENSTIGPYVVLGKNVKVGKNVQIKNSVVFENTRINDSTIISGALVGEGAQIGKNVKITDGCVIADQAKIKDNVTLSEKILVCPAKEVSEETSKLKSNNIC
jgi:mannose-1-phosphate guanylyltransferase